MDEKSACLHSDIQEETYQEQPEGFEKGNDLVCKLIVCLYLTRDKQQGIGIKSYMIFCCKKK